LLQIRGLNVLTAIGVLVEIGDIGLFDTSKQLVAYAGGWPPPSASPVVRSDEGRLPSKDAGDCVRCSFRRSWR
jgi:hypothetical protein